MTTAVTRAADLDLPDFDPADTELRGSRSTARCSASPPPAGSPASRSGISPSMRRPASTSCARRRATFPGLTHRRAVRHRRRARCASRSTATSSTSTAPTTAGCAALVNPVLHPARGRPLAAGDARLPRRAVGARGGRPAGCELVEALAKPYPALTIADGDGRAAERRRRLHDWSMWIQRQFDGPSAASAERAADRAGGRGVLRLVRRAARAPPRRARRRPDVALIAAEEEGDRLSRRRAGEPRPQHARRRRRHHPEPARPRAAAVRRASRPVGAAGRARPSWCRARSRRCCASSRSRRSRRGCSMEDVEYRGRPLPGGHRRAWSCAFTGNRDGREHPDGFDITAERGAQQLLTFGAGIHYCVGREPRARRAAGGARVPRPAHAGPALDGEPRVRHRSRASTASSGCRCAGRRADQRARIRENQASVCRSQRRTSSHGKAMKPCGRSGPMKVST